MKHGLLRLALILSAWIAVACHAAGVPPPRPLTNEETAALLMADDFPRLNAAFTAIQDAYRDRVISDEALRDAFRVFYDTDPARLVHFNAWTQKYPKVYVAQLARGIYFKYLGFKRRGTGFISKTSEQQLRGMENQFTEAQASLYASFELDKKPILSYLHAIDLAKSVGDGGGVCSGVGTVGGSGVGC